MVCCRQLTTGERQSQPSFLSKAQTLPKLRGKRRGDSDHGRTKVRVDRTKQRVPLPKDRSVQQTRLPERQNTPTGAKLPPGLVLLPFAIISGMGHFGALYNGRTGGSNAERFQEQWGPDLDLEDRVYFRLVPSREMQFQSKRVPVGGSKSQHARFLFPTRSCHFGDTVSSW